MTRFLFLLTMYTLPIYVWRSGIPQISHVAGMLWLFSTVIQRPVLRYWKGLIWASLFGTYAFIVNLMVYALFSDTNSLLSSLYYVYNVGIFVAVIETARRVGFRKFFKMITFAMSLLLFIELLIITLGLGRVLEKRWVATFNDPNQMAHWVIWAVLIGIVGGWYLQLGLQFSWFVFLIGILLMIFTASRSGLFGMTWILGALCIISLAAMHRIWARSIFFLILRVMGAVILLTVLGGLFFPTSNENGWLVRLREQVTWYASRVYRVELQTFVEERGYERLFKYPENLILGAGEGANYRWEQTRFTGEIHSTLAGILFSYGIPGLFFFLRFIYLLWRHLPNWRQKLLLLAPFLYSLGTYNLRNTMFWFGLGVLFAVGQATRESRELTPPHGQV